MKKEKTATTTAKKASSAPKGKTATTTKATATKSAETVSSVVVAPVEVAAAPAAQAPVAPQAPTPTAVVVASPTASTAVSDVTANVDSGAKTASVKASPAAVENSKKELAPSAESIAVAAFFLWEKDGYQHGNDKYHWLQAEQLLKSHS
jgi:hypothetical protein